MTFTGGGGRRAIPTAAQYFAPQTPVQRLHRGNYPKTLSFLNTQDILTRLSLAVTKQFAESMKSRYYKYFQIFVCHAQIIISGEKKKNVPLREGTEVDACQRWRAFAKAVSVFFY